MCGGTQYELKCLPCSHSVCTHCIQIENSAQTSVHCPVDENEFPLSNNGIDSLPTKGQLVEVSSHCKDQSPISEMQALLTFTQEYKNDLTTAIRDIEHSIHSSLSRQETSVKQDIRNITKDLVEVILAKEQELYKEVDRVIEEEKREKEQELANFSLQAHHIVQVVQRHQSQFKQGRENASLLNQLQEELQAVNERKNALMEKNQESSTEISFTVNEACFEEPIGKVEYKRIRQTGNGRSKPAHRSSLKSEKTRKPGQVIGTIAPPSPLTEKFRPWALSVSESGHIAVVDRGNNCIHIFNPRGEFLRHVAKPYGSHSNSLEVYGVTFISRNTFAVAEYSPSTGSGCLLEMAISGEHLRVIANLKGPAYVTSFASTSGRGKKIIAVYYTNSLEAPDVLGDEGKLQLPLESDDSSILFHPQKGVFLTNKLIFSDSNEAENRGSVKVFEADGKFSQEFGKQPLWNEEGLGHPLRIAADPFKSMLLVYQQFSNKMRVYDVTGVCASEFDTVSGLLDFSVTPEGRLVATCSKNSECPNSVVMLSYNERQKS